MHAIYYKKGKSEMKYDRLADDDRPKFTEYVRKLLNQSFIIYRTDEEAYRFLNDYSESVNEYLAVLGYKLIFDTEQQIVGLTEDDPDMQLKFMMREKLKKTHTALLACIWKLYFQKTDECMDPDEMFFELHELTELISTWSLSKKELTSYELEEAFRLFSKHNLIKVLDPDLKNRKSRIQMLPSLGLCMETAKFQKVAEELEKEYKIGEK
jgi:hypothetical protein